MQIVIDIDENVFTRLLDNGVEDYEISDDDLSAIAKSIRKGTPLPKGHGDLIDVNEITAFRELECNGYDVESLDEFTTIIEADTAESDEQA